MIRQVAHAVEGVDTVPRVSASPAPRRKVHITPVDPDTGLLADEALCGYLWDRVVSWPTTLPVCGECEAEWKRRHGDAAPFPIFTTRRRPR